MVRVFEPPLGIIFSQKNLISKNLQSYYLSLSFSAIFKFFLQFSATYYDMINEKIPQIDQLFFWETGKNDRGQKIENQSHVFILLAYTYFFENILITFYSTKWYYSLWFRSNFTTKKIWTYFHVYYFFNLL